jgi:hypothetical protein
VQRGKAVCKRRVYWMQQIGPTVLVDRLGQFLQRDGIL